MTLKLAKVRGKENQFVFTYDNGVKVVAWQVDGNDVDTEILTDVVDTVHPALSPAIPQYSTMFPPNGTALQFVQPVIPGLENYGAEAADRAAREEEQRLMNMGSALKRGINMGPEDIPVFEDGDLPEVNWGV
jgi:hypothetical protein